MRRERRTPSLWATTRVNAGPPLAGVFAPLAALLVCALAASPAMGAPASKAAPARQHPTKVGRIRFAAVPGEGGEEVAEELAEWVERAAEGGEPPEVEETVENKETRPGGEGVQPQTEGSTVTPPNEPPPEEEGGAEKELEGGEGGSNALLLARAVFSTPFPPQPAAEAGGFADAAHSRTAFADMSATSALQLAQRLFAVGEPTFEAPGSGRGRKLLHYFGTRAAAEETSSGRKVLVTSSFPLRVRNGAGQLRPLSMSLSRNADLMVPSNPLVPVAIPRLASRSLALPDGVTVTPVGQSDRGEPSIVGDGAFWSSVKRDTDYLVRAQPLGADIAWILRSGDSPDSLKLKFNVGDELSLRVSASVPGAAELTRDGKTLYQISPPAATDAAGRSVATYYTVAGGVLTTHVEPAASARYPVMVDPEIVKWTVGYGGPPGNWERWGTSSPCGCYNFAALGNGASVGRQVSPGAVPGGESFGEWYLSVGSAVEITRVDMQGVYNFPNTYNDDYFGAGTYDNGVWNANGHGVYTENGTNPANTKLSPITTNTTFKNRAMAFCSWGAGGYDGGAQPLCDEEIGSQGFAFLSEIFHSTSQSADDAGGSGVTAAQVRWITGYHPKAEAIELKNSGWFNSLAHPWFEVRGEDQGFGVDQIGADYRAGSGTSMPAAGTSPLPGATPFTVGCTPPLCDLWMTNWYSLAPLGTGQWKIGPWAKTPVQATEAAYEALIDNTAPEIVKPAWAGATVGEGPLTLSVTAHDGTVSAPQSGPAVLEIEVDGKKPPYWLESPCGRPSGIPSPTCMSVTGGPTIQTERYAPGPHTVRVSVEDWAENWSSATYTITIARSADQTEQVGPGVVNLQSGDYKVQAPDVSITAGNTALTLTRTYDSRSTVSGPLGPGWTLSAPDAAAGGQWQGLQVLEDGNVEAITTGGTKALFETKEGGGYLSPAGFQTFTLTELSKSPVIYQISDPAGNYTRFENPSGASEFMPSEIGQSISSGGLNAETFILKEGKTSQIIGPEAKGVSCKTKPTETRGCRVLTLHYATATPSGVESGAELGEYKGQLASVGFTAWNPSSSAMSTVTVAQYAYDKHGRLRAEWDPRTSPALKSTYGYDSEGHLTAVSPAGQEPFILHYGTVSGTSLGAWLLAVIRPSAETSLNTGIVAPGNSSLPTLSTSSPTVGTTMSVASNGSWTGSPVTDSYQWLECSTQGCFPIRGATNQTYTPQGRNTGMQLEAQVTAYNAAGATTATTAKTSTVASSNSTNNPAPEPPKVGSTSVTTIDYGVPVSGSSAPAQMTQTEVARWGQTVTEVPTGATAIFPPDRPEGWPAGEYKRATVYYFDSAGRRVNVLASDGGISTKEYDSYADVVRELTPGNRQISLEAGSASESTARLLDTESTYTTADQQVERRIGPQHQVQLANGSIAMARAVTIYSYSSGLLVSTREGSIVGGVEGEFRTTTRSYNSVGAALHKPTSISVVPASKTEGPEETRTITYEKTTGNVSETKAPGGGEEPSPTFRLQFGSSGSGAGQLAGAAGVAIDGKGNVWVADPGAARIEEFSAEGAFKLAAGWGVLDGTAQKEVCTTSCRSGTSGAGAGQFSHPGGIAYDSANERLYVVDSADNRVDVFSTAGAFVSAFGWGVNDGKAELESCTTTCQAGTAGPGSGQLSGPTGVAIDSAGAVWVADSGNSRLESFTAEGAYKSTLGGPGTGTSQFTGVAGVAACEGMIFATDAGGNRVQRIPTGSGKAAQYGGPGAETGQFSHIGQISCDAENGLLYVSDTGANRVDVFTSKKGEWVTDFGESGSSPGALSQPEGSAVDSAGNVFVVDKGNGRIESWGRSNVNSLTQQTIYYSAAKNKTYAECGLHAEWANLPCRQQPKAQPEDSLGEIPVTITTYNMFDEPATVERRVGGATRVTTNEYDAAGRIAKSSVSSSVGAAVPSVTDEYEASTGLLTHQTAGGNTITSIYNALGQLVSYQDASGNTSTWHYDEDGRIAEVFDGREAQTYVYDKTTGHLTSLKDQAAGTFTASYNLEGAVSSIGLPNGITVTHAYNAVGQDVSVTYARGGTTYYEDTAVPTVHGEWASKHSTLGTDGYRYDYLGRLISVQETPTGESCTTTNYRYDESSDRVSETVLAPSAACTVTAGTSTVHSYDAAGRLADSGTQYDPFGDATVISALDSGGHALETSYYADGTVAEQKQNGTTIAYSHDPAGRNREVVTTPGGGGAEKVIDHYANGESTLAWSESGSSFSRNVIGIGGGIAAIQTGAGVTLEITNLHGDVIGTAADTSGSTPSLTSEPTAFGVPASSGSKHGWLGEAGIETPFESGVASTGESVYVPQLGLHLEPEALGGSPLQDPVGEYQASLYEAAPVATVTENLPGAVQPLPVNVQEMEDFWAAPPWDQEAAEVGGGGEPIAVAAGGVGHKCIKTVIKGHVVQCALGYKLRHADDKESFWEFVESTVEVVALAIIPEEDASLEAWVKFQAKYPDLAEKVVKWAAGPQTEPGKLFVIKEVLTKIGHLFGH
jgi:YD repeat-containing protein